MLEVAEYRRDELFHPDILGKLTKAIGLTETELKNLDFNIGENVNEKGDAYSIVLFFDPSLPREILNRIKGLGKEYVVVIPIEELGLK